ncbi:hypothetical protein XarbCFBP7629_09710 [Xanthomonas arboricola]|nr:hypothetical protein XarbCFBP7629_09710 [Xanthomonas arboricola]
MNHWALTILLGALAAGFYALVLVSRSPDAIGLFDMKFLFKASAYIAVVVVILRYLTMVYRKSTSSFDAEHELISPVQNFAKEFEEKLEDRQNEMRSSADDMADRFNNRGDGT